MLVQVIGTSCLAQVDWYRLLKIHSDRLTVVVLDSVIVKGFLHLEFIFQGGWTRK